jgi:flagellar motor switch protein FliM
MSVETKSLLTEEEMSALLGGPEDGNHPPGSEKKRNTGKIVPYDFRRPDRVSKEQVRSLYLLHDMFSHSISSSLPIFLRTISEVTLISVEQQTYVEYLHGLPDPTAIFTLSMHPLQGVMVLELNPSIAFPIIDRMLGGPGQPLKDPRACTEIEQEILEAFLKVVVDDLREAWNPLINLELYLTGRETRPQMLQIVSPNEVVISIVFHVQIAEARGMMSLCIPAINLEPIIQKFSQSFYSRSRDIDPVQINTLINTTSLVKFEVAAELHGTKASMDDLISIAPGDVLKLNHRVDQQVEVSIAGIVKFNGDLMSQNGNTAVRICSAVADEAAAANR